MFNIRLLVLIQVNLDELRGIQTDSDALSNNLSWVDQIFKDCIMDSCQSAAIDEGEI